MKYRIEKIDCACNGNVKTHYKVAIRYKFLFITWWKYASKTVGSMSEVWSEPLCFDTLEDAKKYCEKHLKPENKCEITRTIL